MEHSLAPRGSLTSEMWEAAVDCLDKSRHEPLDELACLPGAIDATAQEQVAVTFGERNGQVTEVVAPQTPQARAVIDDASSTLAGLGAAGTGGETPLQRGRAARERREETKFSAQTPQVRAVIDDASSTLTGLGAAGTGGETPLQRGRAARERREEAKISAQTPQVRAVIDGVSPSLLEGLGAAGTGCGTPLQRGRAARERRDEAEFQALASQLRTDKSAECEHVPLSGEEETESEADDTMPSTENSFDAQYSLSLIRLRSAVRPDDRKLLPHAIPAHIARQCSEDGVVGPEQYFASIGPVLQGARRCRAVSDRSQAQAQQNPCVSDSPTEADAHAAEGVDTEDARMAASFDGQYCFSLLRERTCVSVTCLSGGRRRDEGPRAAAAF